MSLDAVKNFVRADVSTGYDASATSIVLATGKGSIFPDPATAAYNLVWKRKDLGFDEDPNIEIVRATALSGDTLTITRGQEGTSASTKNEAGKTYEVFLAPTAKMFEDINTALNSKATVLSAYKTADETIVSSTTYQNDDHLTCSIEANAKYMYELVLIVQQDGGSTAGFRARFSAPSGATAYSHVLKNANSNMTIVTSNLFNSLILTQESGAVTGSGDYNFLHANGLIINGASAGSLTIQWAQYVSSSINTILKQGSHLKLIKVG